MEKRAKENCTITKKFELLPASWFALVINWLVELEGRLLVSCNLLGSGPLDSKLAQQRRKTQFPVAPPLLSCLNSLPRRVWERFKGLLFSSQKPFPRDGVETLGSACLKHASPQCWFRGATQRPWGNVKKGLKKWRKSQGSAGPTVVWVDLPRYGVSKSSEAVCLQGLERRAGSSLGSLYSDPDSS